MEESGHPTIGDWGGASKISVDSSNGGVAKWAKRYFGLDVFGVRETESNESEETVTEVAAQQAGASRRVCCVGWADVIYKRFI